MQALKRKHEFIKIWQKFLPRNKPELQFCRLDQTFVCLKFDLIFVKMFWGSLFPFDCKTHELLGKVRQREIQADVGRGQLHTWAQRPRTFQQQCEQARIQDFVHGGGGKTPKSKSWPFVSENSQFTPKTFVSNRKRDLLWKPNVLHRWVPFIRTWIFQIPSKFKVSPAMEITHRFIMCSLHEFKSCLKQGFFLFFQIRREAPVMSLHSVQIFATIPCLYIALDGSGALPKAEVPSLSCLAAQCGWRTCAGR